jgi:prepilin-type N-terminal cleavage/methylation domain-containing protein
MTGHTRQTGFTLIELLVAIFLAGLLVAASFHIHSTFQSTMHRQEEVTRMQQTMKVTRDLLARRIRGAGGGISANLWSACGGEHTVGPFTLHNDNALGGSDLSEGGSDNDPDWFEVVGADHNSSSSLSKQHPLVSRVKHVHEPGKFKPGDLVVIQNDKGACMLMISRVHHKWVMHQPAGWGGAKMTGCFNQTLQMCRREMETNQLPSGTPLINLSPRSGAFRVDDSDPDRPLLMMASGVGGGDPTQYDWQPIAEGVEDMQIAVHVDTDDPPDQLGDEWVNSRDLRANETARVRAVRISLVFRSTSPVPGWSSGRRPGLEDRPASPTNDGYIRRVLSTIIKVRNMPLEVSP